MIRKLSILFILFLSSALMSCTTSKRLTKSEAANFENPDEFLIFHTLQKKYTLADYVFLDDKLQGKLENFAHVNGYKYKIHVYTNSKKYINIKEQLNHVIEIDDADIIKIRYSRINEYKTMAIILSSVAAILYIGSRSVSMSPF